MHGQHGGGDDLAPNTVARISEVPLRRGTITKHEFRHQLAIAAAGRGRERAPRPGEGGYPKFERESLHFVLEGIWIYGEAAEMGIHVTQEEISRGLSLYQEGKLQRIFGRIERDVAEPDRLRAGVCDRPLLERPGSGLSQAWARRRALPPALRRFLPGCRFSTTSTAR
jgi:hypothetical protein